MRRRTSGRTGFESSASNSPQGPGIGDSLAAIHPRDVVARDRYRRDAIRASSAQLPAPSFETARMWRGEAPHEDIGRVFGVASFELG